MGYRGYTEASGRAHANYIAGYSRIEIRVSKEQRDTIQAHARRRGESANAFITRAIQEAIQRDQQTAGE